MVLTNFEMKHSIILLLWLLSCFYSFAEAKLSFIDSVLVNDSIHEEEKYAFFHFRYTNLGDTPLYLVSAKCECPCTSATFSEEALAPGDTAIIVVRYEAKQRPGKVDKTVIVTYNSIDPDEFVSIDIKGYVIPRKEDEYLENE